MYRYNSSHIFLILVLATWLLNYFYENVLLSDNILVSYFEKQLSHDKVLEIVNFKKDWDWLNYVTTPLIYVLKISMITFWILCGLIIFGFKISYKELFRVVLISEFIWLLPSTILIIWFGLIDTSYTFNDVQYFAPLSLLSLFDASQLDSWLIFPLKSLNLFEVIYILVLALGIKKIMKKDYDSALKFTLPVYGSALVVWILFVTFLSINLGA